MKHAAPRNAPLGLAGVRQRSLIRHFRPSSSSHLGTRLALGICPGWASWRTSSASTIWDFQVLCTGSRREDGPAVLLIHEFAPTCQVTCRSWSPCPASCRESAARQRSLHPSAPNSHLSCWSWTPWACTWRKDGAQAWLLPPSLATGPPNGGWLRPTAGHVAELKSHLK